MKLPITFVSAIAIHAVAAVGLAALGHPRGTSAKPDEIGQTIEIDQTIAAPVVHEEEVVAPVPHATQDKRSSRGAPSGAIAIAHATTTATAAPAETNDAPPDPAPTEPVRFKMTMSAQSGSTITRGVATAASTEEVALEADVTERARQVGGVKPAYPADAVAQGVELSSPLAFEIVVDTTGRVVSTRALRHAGYGFDEAALAALRTYRFTPARRNGHAVAVRMQWSVDFKLD